MWVDTWMRCRKCVAIIEQAKGGKGGHLTPQEIKEHLEMLHEMVKL